MSASVTRRCGEALQAVEQIVKDFHDLDRTSIAFRYPTTKERVTIKLPDTSIDLNNVRDIMEALDNFFSGADGARRGTNVGGASAR